jgi:hypothetical protein
MTYIQNPSIYTADLKSEGSLFDPLANRYFDLNRTGYLIWIVLMQPSTVDGIVHELRSVFSVSEDSCREQTIMFINDGLAFGLIYCLSEHVSD